MSINGFSLFDFAALAFFVGAWALYHVAVESNRYGGKSLNAVMNERRRAWLMEAMRRENRIVDTQVMNSLQNGTGFFASTSLLAIGGAFALLQSTDKVLVLFADLPFGLSTTRAVWELKVIGLAIIFAYAFFKFAWSYRLFNYCAILLGAIPQCAKGQEPDGAMTKAMAEAAAMNIVAGRHFNRGQRAFFFAVAYLGWFLGYVVFVLATAAVLIVMWNRQFRSDAFAVIKPQRA